jgi:hypothetical protein
MHCLLTILLNILPIPQAGMDAVSCDGWSLHEVWRYALMNILLNTLPI